MYSADCVNSIRMDADAGADAVMMFPAANYVRACVDGFECGLRGLVGCWYFGHLSESFARNQEM